VGGILRKRVKVGEALPGLAGDALCAIACETEQVVMERVSTRGGSGIPAAAGERKARNKEQQVENANTGLPCHRHPP